MRLPIEPESPRRTAWNRLLFSLFLAFAADAQADGIFRNGVGARAMSMGGADDAWAEGPLGSMAANPAALTGLQRPALDLSLAGVVLDGRFSNAANNNSPIKNGPGFVPDGAFGMRLGTLPLTLGVGVVTEGVGEADWRFVDAPGGANGVTSYGVQRHDASILLLRPSVGLGWAITDKLSVGASVGLLYNENRLQAPYIFQTQPVLAGIKTVLDLRTSGLGYNGNFGLLFKPCDCFRLGLSYTTPSKIQTHGDVDGDLSAQFISLGGGFAAAPTGYHYDANVVNRFPQVITGGWSWQFLPHWRWAAQVDWINWKSAFKRLEINLSNGTNPAVNGLTGGGSLQDFVPLNWRNVFVYRSGLEFAATEHIDVRGGYSFGKNPVPATTITPMEAAISEHTLSAGVGWHSGRYAIDFAYQYNLPSTVNVGKSGLLAGEFNNSRIELESHWLALTTSVSF